MKSQKADRSVAWLLHAAAFSPGIGWAVSSEPSRRAGPYPSGARKRGPRARDREERAPLGVFLWWEFERD